MNQCVIRLGAQIYLEQSDFVSVGEKVLQLIHEYNSKPRDRKPDAGTRSRPAEWEPATLTPTSFDSAHARVRNPCG